MLRSPCTAVGGHQGLQYPGHGGQFCPNVVWHVGLTVLVPLPPLCCGTELHTVRLGPEDEAGPVLVVDPDIAVRKESGHAHTRYPPLPPAATHVGGLLVDFLGD